MRVIAGSARGRRLAGPPAGAATRPTSDKVREALFNVLGDAVVGARVLDLFAGTGALGIEALSRGAAHATFVDADRALCRTIEKNLGATGLADRATVVCRDVRRAAGALRGGGGPDTAPGPPFDLVLIDPPYGLGLEREALALLAARGTLAPGACVVLEHATRDGAPALPPGAEGVLACERSRAYGDTTLTYYRAGGETERATPGIVVEAGEDGAGAGRGGGDDAVVSGAPAPALSTTTAMTTAARSTMTRTAIYPGSFDPLTNGHHDVIRRSLVLFDRLVIAVAPNVRKQPLFEVAERIALIREVVGDDARVEIDTFEGLLVEYATRKGAVAVVRGLRAVADFEYEFAMASMNRRLAPNVETVFLMTHESNFYVSSNLVKEVAALGGDIDAFVPPVVAVQLRARLAARAKR